MLRNTSGWLVNDKRVERIWRQEGLKVPLRQPTRSRIWPGDGACIRIATVGAKTAAIEPGRPA